MNEIQIESHFKNLLARCDTKKEIAECVIEILKAKNFIEVYSIIEGNKPNLCSKSLWVIYEMLTRGFHPRNANEQTELYFQLASNIIIYKIHVVEKYEKIQISEKAFQKKLINQFDKIFPNLTFIKTEYTLSNKKRIDIVEEIKN